MLYLFSVIFAIYESLYKLISIITRSDIIIFLRNHSQDYNKYSRFINWNIFLNGVYNNYIHQLIAYISIWPSWRLFWPSRWPTWRSLMEQMRYIKSDKIISVWKLDYYFNSAMKEHASFLNLDMFIAYNKDEHRYF